VGIVVFTDVFLNEAGKISDMQPGRQIYGQAGRQIYR
jgi:hypothetical protein